MADAPTLPEWADDVLHLSTGRDGGSHMCVECEETVRVYPEGDTARLECACTTGSDTRALADVKPSPGELTWLDYQDDDRGPNGLRDFLKHYTDGDVGHGGCRYRCKYCRPEKNGNSPVEFADHFNARDHADRNYWGRGCPNPEGIGDDWSVTETFWVLRFDADGVLTDVDG